jgi:hypothetical protein
MHIYGTSLGNDVEKAMEMAKLLLISIWINISFRTAIVMFVMDFLKVICYFSLFCHWFIQEKRGISWGSIASSPRMMGNAGESWKS